MSQSLKSPITETASAFGAHTAKYVPVSFAIANHMRAELLPQIVVRAFVEQVQVVVREQAEVVQHRFDDCGAVMVLISRVYDA